MYMTISFRMFRIFDARNNSGDWAEDNGYWWPLRYKSQYRWNSSGDYTGSQSTNYVDDNGVTQSISGGWFSFAFPAYIKFTKYYQFAAVNVAKFSLIGVDENGVNRLLLTQSISSRSENFFGWKIFTITTNYFVNKIYWIFTHSFVVLHIY